MHIDLYSEDYGNNEINEKSRAAGEVADSQ